MCNLYSFMTNRDAIRSMFKGEFAVHESIGNMEPQPGIFPDYPAPVIRNTPGGRELAKVRWGLPSSSQALFEATKKRAAKLEAKGKTVDFDELLKMEPDSGTTNVRNIKSKHWTRWLGVENRCIVPFTSFSENDSLPDGSHPPVWFAGDMSRPLMFFAGIWIPQWTSVRKIKTGMETADLFGFLTTEPNAEVGSIHMKAMPVILTAAEELETWLTAPTDEALKLQRPLPDGALTVVARGERRGDPPEAAAAAA
jgi:putative SOS response-associated peptidase YedK